LRNRPQQGPLPLAEAVRVTREVASALEYAHRLGVLHRDVKLENILVSEGLAVVGDFGLARGRPAGGSGSDADGFPGEARPAT
jgi:serine/threonine-protein kinase